MAAMVQLFFNPSTEEVILVPFARDGDLGVGSRATGPMQRFTREEFELAGADIVTAALAAWETRDFRIPSELYQQIPATVRRRFLRKHRDMNIIYNPREGRIRVYLQHGSEPRLEVDFPLDNSSFGNTILDAFHDACR